MRDKETRITRCLSAGICIAVLVISVIFADGAEKSRETDNYQWSNEADCEPVKKYDRNRTEEGVSIRIVRFCDGAEQVLTDCEYETARFPYYIERYGNPDGDIFDAFYRDDFVWEKTIHAGQFDQTYHLYYAQNIRYDRENTENVRGYEGHLWVTDEDSRIVKRLFWQSKAPYTRIAWDESGLLIQYADGSEKTCTLSEIVKDPAEAIYEKSMLIDYSVKEYPIDTEKYDAVMDQIYKEAYYRAISGQDMVRISEEEEAYLKEYWAYQGDSLMEDETFLKNLIDHAKFYYMDFDGDGLPELIMDIVGDGLHILKYLPEEEIVEIFFGYERTPYFHLLGSGQLYYENGMIANMRLWKYMIVDEDGQDSQVVYFEENADYKPHKENEDEWWDMAYWIYLDEELGLVQVDEKRYREITENFLDAVEHAPAAMTFDEVFGEDYRSF